MMKPRIAAVGVLLLTSLVACKKAPDPNTGQVQNVEPSPLLMPGMSYWDFEKAQHGYGYNAFETLEDRQPLVSDKRPPFRRTVIRVPNFKDHGFTGDLVLTFINNRLMETQFYPANVKDYIAAIGPVEKFALGSDNVAHIAPHTRVWLGKDIDGREYLGMSDDVLKQQANDWILRYSAG